MLSTTAKRLFSSYCSHTLFYRAPANASFTESSRRIPDLDRCNYTSFTFARRAGPSGDQNLLHNYIDRGQVEFNRRGSFTLARVNLYILMSHIPRVNCVLCLGGRIRCLHVVKEV